MNSLNKPHDASADEKLQSRKEKSKETFSKLTAYLQEFETAEALDKGCEYKMVNFR